MIEVKGLKKSFKEKEVIHGINFSVSKGEILCFLGPNGAGKSTTINIMTGVLKYNNGEILYEGKDIYQDIIHYKKQLGIVPQDLALYEDLSAERNVMFFASLYGLKGKELKESCQKPLEFVGILDRAKDKVKTFSGGMKRRVNIACAIAHKPNLLIMDEPTVGIDPQSRNYILEGVKKLRDEGMTILYTTHYMEEVEEISTRIIIMDEGKILAKGTKEEMKSGIHNERHFNIWADQGSIPDMKGLLQIEGVKKINMDGEKIEITTLKDVENLDKIISYLISLSVKIKDISCQSASLETVFLSLTGKRLRD